MKKICLIIFVNSSLFINVYSQLKDTTMIERFNYSAVEALSPQRTLLQEGEWLIGISYTKDTKTGYQREIAPARYFYIISKVYHPNGIINSYTKVLGRVAFGERKFYDDTGKLIKVIDEDAKFGKVKPDDFVAILEKIGWINRETGENIVTKEPLKTDGSFTINLHRLIEIYFFPAEYDKEGKEIKPPFWQASYTSEYLHNNIRYYCYVDGNTGEYRLEEQPFYVIP